MGFALKESKQKVTNVAPLRRKVFPVRADPKLEGLQAKKKQTGNDKLCYPCKTGEQHEKVPMVIKLN